MKYGTLGRPACSLYGSPVQQGIQKAGSVHGLVGNKGGWPGVGLVVGVDHRKSTLARGSMWDY